MPSPTALRRPGRLRVIVATPRSITSSNVRYCGGGRFGCDAGTVGTPVSSPWSVIPSRKLESATLTQAASPQATPLEVWPGKAYPLGATYDGAGTNFALFSEIAEKVELCLFDADGTQTACVTLPEVDGFVWHG